MRVVDYSAWKQKRRDLRAKLLELENSFEGHAPGRRPRDPEKEKFLSERDIARLKRYKETGKLQIIGPRHWRWRIDLK